MQLMNKMAEEVQHSVRAAAYAMQKGFGESLPYGTELEFKTEE